MRIFLALVFLTLSCCQNQNSFIEVYGNPRIWASLPKEAEVGIWLVEVGAEGVDSARQNLPIQPVYSLPSVKVAAMPPLRIEFPKSILKLEKDKKYLFRLVYSPALHIRREIETAVAEFVLQPGDVLPGKLSFTEFKAAQILDLDSPLLLEARVHYPLDFPIEAKKNVVAAVFTAVSKFSDGRPGLNHQGQLLAWKTYTERPVTLWFLRSEILHADYFGRIEAFLFDCGDAPDKKRCVLDLYKNRGTNLDKVFPLYQIDRFSLDTAQLNQTLLASSIYDFNLKTQLP